MNDISSQEGDPIDRSVPEAIPVRSSARPDPESAAQESFAGEPLSQPLSQLSRALQIPVRRDLETLSPDPTFLKKIAIGSARNWAIMGFKIGDVSHIAICDRDGWRHLDTAARAMARDVKPILAERDTILSAINNAYSDRGSQAQETLESIDKQQLLSQLASSDEGEDLLDTEGRAPIIRLVNQLLFDAVKAGASDIHIQPYEDRVIVRQRIDGVLFDSFEVPKAIQEEVLTRIKVLGKMNIAEKRLPQDGRATVQLGDRVVDLRIASLPTSHNERIVIRLLDKSARLYTLGELGMPSDSLSRFRELIRYDHGLILVTGPTGSGKSTTLYGALQEINSTDLNVLTLEDPIEYQLDGISQTQINEKKGLTFASGLRSVLRQDPDIVMVGEIRDQETAQMAIQASLTGHLVFSTLHTNDAASAVTRLLDLGIEPYLVASSLIGSLAQRLVRRLCENCKKPVSPEVGKHGTFYAPVGCENCRNTGYRGRVGLYELLTLNDSMRGLIQQRAGAPEIRNAALDSGLRLLSWDGIDKVQLGMTTKNEVLRVTSLPDE